MNRPPDMRQLMKQAQQMQAQLLEAQQQLSEREYEGSAGGGVVKARVTGAHRVVAIEIAPEVIDPEDPELLEDLVMAAVNAAMTQAATAAESELGGLAGGLGGFLG